MTLTLLHTSSAHVPVFAALRDRIAPGAALDQAVREDWLAEARAKGVTDDLAARIAALVARTPGPVICTCTTLGPVAEAAGATRIDRPMMQAAGRIGGRILMAYALESTAAPSRQLLAEQLDRDSVILPLDLTALWPLFEAGEHSRFHAGIAAAVAQAARREGADCVVLAQVSMAGAREMLPECGAPVLSSPEIALRAAWAVSPPA